MSVHTMKTSANVPQFISEFQKNLRPPIKKKLWIQKKLETSQVKKKSLEEAWVYSIFFFFFFAWVVFCLFWIPSSAPDEFRTDILCQLTVLILSSQMRNRCRDLGLMVMQGREPPLPGGGSSNFDFVKKRLHQNAWGWAQAFNSCCGNCSTLILIL